MFCRYDFHLSQAVTASLPQFVLQFSAYMLVSLLLSKIKVEDPTFHTFFKSWLVFYVKVAEDS